MSPKLKPLLLPQLVEERRKLELVQQANDGDHTYHYYAYNSSSSDLASPSPMTPTFSRASHSRFSGSVSSLEIASPSTCQSPASPPPVPHPPHSNNTSKPQLPDVQEEPVEREDEDSTAALQHFDHDYSLYDCLCESGWTCCRALFQSHTNVSDHFQATFPALTTPILCRALRRTVAWRPILTTT